jgi:hypothetical protein
VQEVIRFAKEFNRFVANKQTAKGAEVAISFCEELSQLASRHQAYKINVVRAPGAYAVF